MSKYNFDLDYLIDDVDIFKEELDEIISEAEQIINSPPNNVPERAKALLKKGQCLQKLGKSQDSKSPIEEALKLQPEMPEALARLGIICLEKGRFEDALANFEKSIQAQNNYAYGFFMRGIVYMYKGDFDQAMVDINQAITLKPDFASAYNTCGSVCLSKKDYEYAIQYFDKALGLNPNFYLAYNNRGLAYNFKGDYEKAIHDFDSGIELRPRFFQFYLNRGISYLQKKDYELALQDCSLIIKYNPSFFDAYKNRGAIYLELREYDRALADFSEAIYLKPDYDQAYYNRGLAYYKKGDYTKAIQEYDKAIHHNPANGDAYNNRGNVYNDQGDYDKAIEDYEKVISIRKDDHVAYNNRAFSYACKKDYNRAIENYNQAIKIKSDYALAYCNRGISHKQKNEYVDALKDFIKAITLEPSYKNFGNLPIVIGNIFQETDIGFLWEFEPNDLKKMPYYFCNIIATFKEHGYVDQNHKDLINSVQKLWKSRRYDNAKEKDGLIYQYTSLEVLAKMREKRSLRLTPAAYLNDPEEGKALFASMLSYIKEKQVKKIEKIVKRVRNDISVNSVAFVRSFSENEDSLVMWNSPYGDTGNGVAVGIKKSVFNKNFGNEFIGQNQSMSASINMRDDKSSEQEEIRLELGEGSLKTNNNPPRRIECEKIGLYKILYLSKNLDYAGNNEKDIADIGLIKEITECLVKLKYEQANVLVHLLAELFVPIAHLVKDRSYEHEQEYRIMCIGQIDYLRGYIDREDGIFIETEKIIISE
jgi:tetratricopeptide (TPR) repeat protein